MLDLDETLIHSELVDIDCEEHAPTPTMFYVHLDDFAKVNKKLLVRKRPFLMEFLLNASQKYQLVVFTAGMETYADAVLDELDPTRVIFSKRLYRQHCTPMECQVNDTATAGYSKNLHVLETDMERTVLVDNSMHSFAKDQLENAVPIPSYINDHTDFALILLSQLLCYLAESGDVRFALAGIFNLSQKRIVSDVQSPVVEKKEVVEL